MSEHAWALENLAAYLTGGLEPAERERLEQHTAGCEPCAAALTAARDVDTALSGLFAAGRPGADLEDRAIHGLWARTQRSGWRLPIPGWLIASAAALVLIGATGAVMSQLIGEGELPFPGIPRYSVHSYGFEPGRFPTGSMSETLWGYNRIQREGQDVDQLARLSREKAINDLDGQKQTPPSSPLGADWGDDAPPDGTSNAVKYRAELGGKSAVHTWHLPENLQTRNPYTYNPGSPNTPPAPTEPAKPTKKGPPSDYFKPSELPAAPPDKEDKGKELPPPSKEAPKDDHGPKPPPKPQPQDQPRKIVIRSGEVEFEVESFDAAVATITRLIKDIRGGFVDTVNSEKLANGKVRGTVVVRVPPERLDGLVLDLRRDLGKTGELKSQRIRSEDITKKYTDLESRLRAARAMEERLLAIIKNGKGEIKDLLSVEKELGTWRTRIEEIEGELRYYGNLVALSTLTITVWEKEILSPFAVVETERVRMGIEVEDADLALREAQKAVREAKGRITRSELKQHSAGQFSATLHFEVAPEAAGPVRDRLKQLGTVARLDIDRLEENEGGAGRLRDGKTKRQDTRFFVSIYNLTNIAPRETVHVNLACVDTEAAFKALLAQVEKADGRVVSSNLNSSRSEQTQGTLQFEVKAAAAEAVLEEVKKAGEVMRLQVTENPDVQNTTRKKRGFHVELWALATVAPRETKVIQAAAKDVPAAYRSLREAVTRAKGRMLNAQLNEQDRQNITATLDFEVRRGEEAALQAALTGIGDIFSRNVTRAPEGDNVIDSKVRWQLTLISPSKIPPRETYVLGIEVRDVDQTVATLSALVGERQGRTVDSNVSRERSGRVTAKLVYDVPLGKAHELLDSLRSAGSVRVQQATKRPDVPDSPLSVARLDVTLSNVELIVPSDEGFWPRIRSGLSASLVALSWSLMVVVVGVCFVLPWAVVIYGLYRLVLRLRGRPSPATPAA